MKKPRKMRPVLAWAIFCDSRFYRAFPTRWRARDYASNVHVGSKYKWRVARVQITEVGARPAKEQR
jgi:hypothetical protein